ncbi:Iron-sulfur cluster-binding protein [hydrothermal vent metagenome]|uniref:Iron-sulfur cluster-binding protein n=1 Tax=hydrothermal vent metagenome TaxID=652676 RepID=A0A3B1ASP6_9ZZZZ
MPVIKQLTAIPTGQKYRYFLIMISCLLFFAPFAFLPGLVGNSDFCGELCIRRFFLYFPGMSLADLGNQLTVAWIGVIVLSLILTMTFFFGRMWCSYICPVGGFPELVSRTLNDRWKIEYRALPQVPIRYGYFSVYLILMPILGISACTLCNFITVPRLFESLSGGFMGLMYVFSTIGLVNIALLFLLGFFASKGRAYCQFLCPIGALDGLVNRLGSMFKFTRRIRVERSRCTGCNMCARNCMTGAIKMIDQIAVVDQHSCMSCHECVDVCDWGAIDWLSVHPNRDDPKRKKKGIDFHPQLDWVAVHVKQAGKNNRVPLNWGRIISTVLFALIIMFVILTQVQAEKRHSDPDGCLSCHQLSGLDYINQDGVLRSASIDIAHYYSSLHGSVPCKDCHRKIQDYPHKAKNGEVDCSESCHVEEPSVGEAYTHKNVVKEFSASVHGDGKSKGFTGANRLTESEEEQNPSCRTCHNNSLYIDETQLSSFKKDFSHTETECGNCHKGEVWLSQFGGHILRRFIENRWDKKQQNAICKQCHDDPQRMRKVKLKDKETGKEQKPGLRLILASASYDMSLHGKLVNNDKSSGASCNECHTPGVKKHSVLAKDNIDSSTYSKNLDKTCGLSECHAYSEHVINEIFLKTDMHDLDLLPINYKYLDDEIIIRQSGWSKALMLLAPVVIVLAIGMLFSMLFGKKRKGVVFSRFGGDYFQRKMIGRKPKGEVKKKKAMQQKKRIKP